MDQLPRANDLLDGAYVRESPKKPRKEGPRGASTLGNQNASVCPCTRPQMTLGQKLLHLEFSGFCEPLYKLVEPEEGVVETPDL